MHKKNIIHRDIKPENILLDKDLNVKLGDFGWSCYYSKINLRKSFSGTMEYMAPEIYLKKAQSFSVDIWALGVLIYEIFHNKVPFE